MALSFECYVLFLKNIIILKKNITYLIMNIVVKGFLHSNFSCRTFLNLTFEPRDLHRIKMKSNSLIHELLER